uniref:Activin_recp domain-containing protein n=1 Tax=Globodera pallida TaxID=36090 RepID=A0A183C7C9_GLOPA
MTFLNCFGPKVPSSSSFIGFVLPLFLLLPLSALSLQCYQSQQSLTDALQGNALGCPAASLSCTKSIDFNAQIIARGCQSSNCTFPNGTASVSPICFNSSNNAQQQSYCCCYGDNCNGTANERRNWLMTWLNFAIMAAITAINAM